MKITEVRAVQPIAPNSPSDWRTSMGQILVAIDAGSVRLLTNPKTERDQIAVIWHNSSKPGE